MQDIRERIEKMREEQYLAMHPYSIWKGNDENWHTYLPDKEKGRIAVKRTTEVSLKGVVIDFWKQKSDNPKIKEVFTEWNDRKLALGKIVESTHLRNKQVFNRHYGEFGEKRIKDVTEEGFQDFLEEQIPRFNLTAKAFSNLKSITKGYLKRAKKRKLITYNVQELFDELDTSDTDFAKVIKEDYEEVFDDEEMSCMMTYLVEHKDPQNIGIMLMFITGIRVGELVTLRHADFEYNSFKIRRTEMRYVDDYGKYQLKVKEFPKTDAGVRTVIVPTGYDWILKDIRKLNPFGEYVFVNDNGRISAQAIRMRLKKLCQKLKIYPKSPHKIRKTYGSILLDNHVDNQIVIGQMGHTDISCTENHYHRNRKSLEKKTEILSSIPEFMAQ